MREDAELSETTGKDGEDWKKVSNKYVANIYHDDQMPMDASQSWLPDIPNVKH